ncbi:DUF2336 domain-containing protein [Pseudolabrys sp. Root1462]|uniref:DUF2336 domain-containing protein n=1 Tax=Pseudolabrys sp. Root1462 TaxID=1736466 RepID=UPI00138F4B39|nr:DUF2336 domain-containing protein [Pseudolabrys sp. Root1462]
MANSLLGDLEDALTTGTPERRTETLRRVTDLFLGQADRLNDEQVRVFDDVLVHLIMRVETRALVRLGGQMAHIENAPLEMIRNLTRHDEIAVAGPVLTHSPRLGDADLIDVARSRDQDYLLAISHRTALSEDLTDVLLKRGQVAVAHALAQNRGARFSEDGFADLVRRAEGDDSLAEWVGKRLDIPLNLLRRLLAQATAIVRSKLLAAAPPERRADIQLALDEIASRITLEAERPRDYTAANGAVFELNRQGQLTEAALLGFANDQRQDEVVATLALFCGVSTEIIEKLMQGVSAEGLIVACKASKLSWPTVAAILNVRFSHHALTDGELAEAKTSFLRISQSVAQRTLRFMKVRDVTGAMPGAAAN